MQLSLCRLTLRRSDDDDDGVDYKHGNDEEARVSRDVTITTSMMTMPDDDDENDNNNSQDEYDDNDNNTDDDDACGLGGRDQARAELAEEFRLRDAAGLTPVFKFFTTRPVVSKKSDEMPFISIKCERQRHCCHSHRESHASHRAAGAHCTADEVFIVWFQVRAVWCCFSSQAWQCCTREQRLLLC